MRISTSMLYRRGVEWMNKHQSKLAKTNAQIVSVNRIQKPSDDPTGSARIMELHKQLKANEQYERNITIGYGRQAIEETAITEAGDIFQQARELAIRANNAGMTSANRQSMALEVRQLRQQLMDIANTKDADGAYMFAGYKEMSQPFSTAANGDVVYNGDQGQRSLQIGVARQVTVGDPGDSVFMQIRNGNGQFRTDMVAGNKGNGTISVGSVIKPTDFTNNFMGGDYPYSIEFTVTPDPHVTAPDTPPEPLREYVIKDANGVALGPMQTYTDGAAIKFHGIEVKIEGKPETGDKFVVKPSDNQSMFKTLDNLLDALGSTDRTPADVAVLTQRLDNALTDIDQGLLNINQVRGRIGSRLNAMTAQDEVNQDLNLQLENLKAEIGSTDIAEAASRMSQELLALQATQQTFMKVQGLSLFNYLK